MAQASLFLTTKSISSYCTKQCKFCEKIFKSKSACNSHEQVVHCPKISSCQLCKKMCTSPLALRNHMKIHEILECNTCGKIMNGFNYATHLKSHQGEIKKYDKIESICKECGKVFQWKKTSDKTHEDLLIYPIRIWWDNPINQ